MFYNFYICGQIVSYFIIYYGISRIFRYIYNRLNTKISQILYKFQPTLYTRTSCRCPIISNNKYLFHSCILHNIYYRHLWKKLFISYDITPLPINSSPIYHTANCPSVIALCIVSNSIYNFSAP